MTGLDKILEKIQQETQREEEKILSAAQQQSEEFREKAERQLALELNQKREQQQKKIELLQSSSISSAHKEGKNLLLQVRRQLMETAFSQALDQLNQMDTPEYFVLLEKIAAHNMLPQKGELVLSQSDARRMPETFLQNCVGKAPQGGGLSLSEERRELGGGFVLRYEDMEINCSFPEILSANREELEDMVNRILFDPAPQEEGDLK